MEGVGGLFGLFFENPVTAVFEDDDRYVGGDEFGLIAQRSAEGVIATDAEDRHRQLGMRELGEVFGGLGPCCEVGPGGVHFAGAGVGGGVDLTVWFGDGVGLVVGEVVPEKYSK